MGEKTLPVFVKAYIEWESIPHMSRPRTGTRDRDGDVDGVMNYP